jgi:hypothetical protein
MKIAVELDPPAGNGAGDALAFLSDGARALARAGADFITMADNPAQRRAATASRSPPSWPRSRASPSSLT